MQKCRFLLYNSKKFHLNSRIFFLYSRIREIHLLATKKNRWKNKPVISPDCPFCMDPLRAGDLFGSYLHENLTLPFFLQSTHDTIPSTTSICYSSNGAAYHWEFLIMKIFTMIDQPYRMVTKYLYCGSDTDFHFQLLSPMANLSCKTREARQFTVYPWQNSLGAKKCDGGFSSLTFLYSRKEDAARLASLLLTFLQNCLVFRIFSNKYVRMDISDQQIFNKNEVSG